MDNLINTIINKMTFTSGWKLIDNENLYSFQEIAEELKKKNVNVSTVYEDDSYMSFNKNKLYFSMIKNSNKNKIEMICNYALE
jgi:hypothetical protein